MGIDYIHFKCKEGGKSRQAIKRGKVKKFQILYVSLTFLLHQIDKINKWRGLSWLFLMSFHFSFHVLEFQSLSKENWIGNLSHCWARHGEGEKYFSGSRLCWWLTNILHKRKKASFSKARLLDLILLPAWPRAQPNSCWVRSALYISSSVSYSPVQRCSSIYLTVNKCWGFPRWPWDTL